MAATIHCKGRAQHYHYYMDGFISCDKQPDSTQGVYLPSFQPHCHGSMQSCLGSQEKCIIFIRECFNLSLTQQHHGRHSGAPVWHLRKNSLSLLYLISIKIDSRYLMEQKKIHFYNIKFRTKVMAFKSQIKFLYRIYSVKLRILA